jgi:hypothetical protein
MIVSHCHRFIFVHLGRTGGRSLTEALARHCGPRDIITWTSGKVPGQNAAGFGRHDSAREIRTKVGERVWNEYFKFTFERNPWEKIVSRYWAYASGSHGKAYKRVWQRIVGKPLSFAAWFRMKVWQGRLLGLGHIRLPAQYRDYTERGRILVDFVGRCENRTEHVALLSERLGIEIRDDLRHGSEFHHDRKPYTELFDPWMQRIVESVFRPDLALLGYRFGQPPPQNALWIEDGRVREELAAEGTALPLPRVAA